MDQSTSGEKPSIHVSANGPYIIRGPLPLDVETIVTDLLGRATSWKKGPQIKTGAKYTLCRCGNSKTMPFCDGSHVAAHFDGKESAENIPYDQIKKDTLGPDLILSDAEKLCAGARFCEIHGGTWKLTEKSDNPDHKKEAIQQAKDCPSGRLVARDISTNSPIEPAFEKSLSLIEDPMAECSGPIWVKGGVPIYSEKGELYEIRNRVTLCRCGSSANKPFCDGSHIKTKFKAQNSADSTNEVQ